MRKIIAATLLLATMATAASASCPVGTKYQCTQGFNGKVVCGCY